MVRIQKYHNNGSIAMYSDDSSVDDFNESFKSAMVNYSAAFPGDEDYDYPQIIDCAEDIRKCLYVIQNQLTVLSKALKYQYGFERHFLKQGQTPPKRIKTKFPVSVIIRSGCEGVDSERRQRPIDSTNFDNSDNPFDKT